MVARWFLAVGGVVSLLAACGTDPGVATQSAERLVTPTPTTEGTPATTVPAPPTTDEAPTTTADAPPPTAVVPPTTQVAPPPDPGGGLGDRVDGGDAKPARDYDDFVRLALNDIERWWGANYPGLYGQPYEPLAGGVYAGYPERTAPIPGCETDAPTKYREIAQYSAFYCMDGDFMVYDDGPDGVLAGLAAEFGSSILGVVFAHEFGHAIQGRAGVLDRDLPTIVSEQQADCFAGAWVAHVRDGGAEGITFTDADVRSGLVAMITVRDPIGVDTTEPGGHGSAFDRVGAFQTGFAEGPGRCVPLADDPLPLVPNTFQATPSSPEGNSPYDEAAGFIPTDAQRYWNAALAAQGLTMPTLTVVPVRDAAEVACDDPSGSFTTGALYCPSTQQIFFDDGLARDLYDRFGDFVIGYTLGGAYSQAAQVALGSTLQGEQRFLADDCLTGAWSSTLLPANADPDDDRDAYIEPGDLDEAIQAALVIGDDSASDNVLGSGFEKIASFREGVLDGLGACLARIGD